MTKKSAAPARTTGVDTSSRAGAAVPVSERVHMMTPNMTTLCRCFTFKGAPLKTDNRDMVTYPKCLQLTKRKPTCQKAAQ